MLPWIRQLHYNYVKCELRVLFQNETADTPEIAKEFKTIF